ncbi:MAG: outer membrane protein transport protein [Gemmatimonadaceae bacterium]
MSFLRHARWLAVAAVCFPAASASAQGFGLSEIGTCAVSRGFAVTGSPCADASTIFWNPAATAELSGTTIDLGGSIIAVKGAFLQDSTGRNYKSNIQPAAVPSFFASKRFGNGALGIGVYVPYGLTSQWHDDFPGRFSALRAALQTIYVQPNIAYQFSDHWSVGGGPVIGHSTVDLTQSIDLSQQAVAPGVTFGLLGIASQTEFARAQFHGTSNAVGYNVGVHGRFDDWSIGARFLSQLTFNYKDARANFTQIPTGLTLAANNPISPTTAIPLDGFLASQFSSAKNGALVNQTGSSRIVHPWQMQGGVGYNGFQGTKLSVDIARLGWSTFNTLPISFNGPAKAKSRSLIENYDDSWAYRFGAEHQFNRFTGRVGYSYAQSPAPDVTVTPLLPDMNRDKFSAGIAVPMSNMYKVELGYVHVNTPGRRGRIVERSSASQDVAQLNDGTYSLSANVFSASLHVNF